MVLPIQDIIAVQTAKSFRFGYSGLVIVVRGHEELFFEFTSKEKRDDLIRHVERQLELAREDLAAADARGESRASKEEKQAQMLKDLEASSRSAIVPGSKCEEHSPIMFSSTTSSFVTFTPPKPLKSTFRSSRQKLLTCASSRCSADIRSRPKPTITQRFFGSVTCLTIGSRGDVQPYIALCKGLMQDGHKCRIASHAEYKDWVEQHGIEFKAVGGDPAELMR